MKKIKHLNESEKNMALDKKNSKNFCQGITQRLLDKYKPSREFKAIVSKNLKNNEPKAA